MSTNIAYGSALAVKAFSAAVFAQTQRKPSLRRNLTGPAPKQADAESKLKGQSTPDMPIVQVRDLVKNAGDSVSVDMINITTGKPVTGDRKLAGKFMSLSFNSMDVKLDQWRGGVDGGGRMTQKRTKHNLRGIGMANLTGWASRLEDQTCLVHLAGARGFQNTKDWVVPLASDEDYATIMVNTVKTPSFNNHFWAGTGDDPTDLGSSDILTLDDIDRLKATLDDMDFPMQPIKLPGDDMGDDEPMYLLLVTPRQWHFLQNRTGDKAWRTFLQNAWNRASSFKSKHPLFLGEPGMWNNILVKKTARSIRFPAGQSVAYFSNATTETSATAPVDTDRAILLGAQALVDSYGIDGDSGTHYRYFERMVAEDHNNSVEMSISGIAGKAKVRFTIDGQEVDHGVMVIDSYAPDPRTTTVA